MTALLLSDLQSGALTLTLNRPSRANAFNFDLTVELLRALNEAQRDPQTRCVVITGAGKVFSSGQDISEMEHGQDVSYREHLEQTYKPLVLQLRNMEKPVIAAINGVCAGAALGIALACDIRIAHARALFVVGFGGIGLAPDSAVSLLLPVHIGLSRAQEYFYSNKPFTAREAYKWGMVNRVAYFNFEGLVRHWANALASGPAEAFAAGKKAFNKATLPNLDEVLAYEGDLQDALGKSDAHRERVAAFLAKRAAK